MGAYDWIIGLGMAFALSLMFTMFTSKRTDVFLVYLLIFTSFTVYVGLLPLWTIIIQLILLTGLVYLQIKKRGSI